MGFRGRLGRRGFAIALGLCIGLYLAATFGYVAMMMGLAASCSGSPGCGAVGLVLSVTYKPLIFTLTIAGLIVPMMGRLRDIGVTPWLSLFVLLLLVADNGYLVFAGTPWSFGFTAGVFRIEAPVFAATALALMVLLAIVPPREGTIGPRALGWLLWPLLVVGVLVGLAALYRVAWSMPGTVSAIRPLIWGLGWPIRLGGYALPLLPVLAGIALWPRRGQAIEPRPELPAHPVPVFRLLLVAVAITVVVLTIAMPEMWQMGAWLVGFTPIVLPNVALWFAVVLTGHLWWRRRVWPAGVLTVVLAAVFGSWGWLHYDAAFGPARDAAEVAAIPKVRPDAVPPVLFLEPDQNAYLRPLLRRADIDIVAQKQQGKFIAFEMDATGEVKVAAMTALPERHLLLKTWSLSAYHRGGQYAGSSPYELRLIDKGEDTLLSVWFQRSIDRPTVLPVIGPGGWRTAGDRGDRLDREEAMARFMDEALGDGKSG